jgi:hypothetical protein
MTIDNENQIDHDAMFKELLHQLIEPFLKLFFPEEASLLDFSSIVFLEQEQFTFFLSVSFDTTPYPPPP